MKNKDFIKGLKAGLPVILGFIPVGIAYAIIARQAGFSVFQTCLMSLTVFAGASQMMAAGMVAETSSIIAIVIATFILNLRHIIMSMCVFNKMDSGKGMKYVAAFGVTDESFAVFTTDKKHNSIKYFLGLMFIGYASWNVGTLIGAIASDILPTVVTLSLGISLYAMFIGLLVPNLKGNWKLAALVLLTCVCNFLLNLIIESSWALVISTIVCAFIGVFFVDLKEDTNNE